MINYSTIKTVKFIYEEKSVFYLLIRENYIKASLFIKEIISIDQEMTFIVSEDDAVVGYKALQKLIL